MQFAQNWFAAAEEEGAALFLFLFCAWGLRSPQESSNGWLVKGVAPMLASLPLHLLLLCKQDRKEDVGIRSYEDIMCPNSIKSIICPHIYWGLVGT